MKAAQSHSGHLEERIPLLSPHPYRHLSLLRPLSDLTPAAASDALLRKFFHQHVIVDLSVLSCEPFSERDRAQHQTKVLSEWGFDNHFSMGKGINALFTGVPGTGKTMAAEAIARELELDLYKIDLSQIVSKYIGETEKNLDRIFTAAATSNAILLFDEADALFGKRSEVKDARDRYANIEIGYLLQKMEEYEGIAILTTNLGNNIDDAFTRRLSFIIGFPFPKEAE